MSILSSSVMGLDGAVYCAVGLCMLAPQVQWKHGNAELGHAATVYASMFRRFQGGCGGSDAKPGELPTVHEDPLELWKGDVCFRCVAYLLLVLGLCRALSSLFWGCGYIYLGLGSCICEIAIVCNEILRHESLILHRGMIVLLKNMGLSLLYISAAAPYCT
jgi:hypothetical protein